MDKNKKITIIVMSVVAFLIVILGSVYAFFSFSKEGNDNNKLVAGEIYMNFTDGGDDISLEGVYPMTREDAKTRTNNYITFTIEGKNTSENKDIYYEIVLNDDEDILGKTRLNYKDLRFELVKIIGEDETVLVNGLSYNDFDNRVIWVDTVPRNTTTPISISYRLRMWVGEDVIISDTESDASYSASVYKNLYANVKVSVNGDLVEKMAPHNYLVNSYEAEVTNFWPTVIKEQIANISEVHFIELSKTQIDLRYDTAIIKADLTDANQGSVKGWLETDTSDNTKYIFYIASEGTTVFPVNSANMFSGFTNVKRIEFINIDTSNVTSTTSMFNGCTNLTNLDLSSFDTSQVSTMTAMFRSCANLTDLNLSSFDTSQVTAMGLMFNGCTNLTNLDLSSFDISKVSTMTAMFSECNKLENLDISNFTFNSTLKGTASRHLGIFSNVGTSNSKPTIITVKDLETQSWIVNTLDAAHRPDVWNYSNVLIKS